ncbi:MAG: hypothetical protein ACP5MG_01255 [Verrucomicrobiia bacterium]
MNNKRYKFCLANASGNHTANGSTNNSTFTKAPMLWDLIKAEEFLLQSENEGKVENRHYHICVIYALFKLAYKNRCGNFTATISLISHFSGLSRRTVIRILPKLEKLGLISIIRRNPRWKPNIFSINPVLLIDDSANEKSTCADNTVLTDIKEENVCLNNHISLLKNSTHGVEPPASNESYITNNPEKLFTVGCEQLSPAVTPSHISGDCQSPNMCLPVTALVTPSHTLKNNIIQRYFYSKDSNRSEKDIKKVNSPIINTTKQDNETANFLTITGDRKSQNQPDTRTLMVQITMLRKKLDETRTAMSELIHDGSFYNDKDKQKYYELKTLKGKIIKKLNQLYDSVGLEELKLREPSQPTTQ